MGSLEQILKGAQVVIKISPQPHILLMWLNPERACSAHEKKNKHWKKRIEHREKRGGGDKYW